MRHATIPIAAVAAMLLAACQPQPGAFTAHGRGLTPTAGLPTGWREPPRTGAQAGTAIGAFLHPETLRHIRPGDRAELERAILRAHGASPGQRVEWLNRQTGSSGTVTTDRAARTPDGRTCKTMLQMIVADGLEYNVVTSACQSPDGTWTRGTAP